MSQVVRGVGLGRLLELVPDEVDIVVPDEVDMLPDMNLYLLRWYIRSGLWVGRSNRA